VTTRESQEWEELGENEKRVEDRRGGREREREWISPNTGNTVFPTSPNAISGRGDPNMEDSVLLFHPSVAPEHTT
jgi:hypothetical protein